MHMWFVIAIAVFVPVDGARKLKKRAPKLQSQSLSGMRNDIGTVGDQGEEASFGVHASEAVDDFENQIAMAKESQIWWKVEADKTTAPLPPVWKAIIDSMKMLTFDNLFDRFEDEKPKGEAKVIHMQGVACKFSMKVTEASPYTGILAPGTTNGIMRMGSPAPDFTHAGISLKWFRSYVHSGNTLMMGTASSENPFEYDFSNHIAPPGSLELLREFLKATMCTASTGLSDLCMYDQDGNDAGDSVNFPYELYFESLNRTLAAVPADRADYNTEVIKQLSSIPAGTKLFAVKARSEPRAKSVEIGEFTLSSQCSPSLFADTALTFKHWRMEDDLELRPEWIDEVIDICNEGVGEASQVA